MKLTEVTPNKYSPSTFLCIQTLKSGYIEIMVLENDKTNELVKLAFITSNNDYKQGNVEWHTYDWANKFDIVKEIKLDIQQPIYS